MINSGSMNDKWAALASLGEEGRGELKGRLERRLAPESDGAIDLVARAWSVRGIAS